MPPKSSDNAMPSDIEDDEASSNAHDLEELPRFPHLLNSYTDPLTSEVGPVNAYINDIQADLDESQSEISLLRSRVQWLQERIDILVPTAFAYRSIFAPWRRLQVEILTYIFILAIGAPENKGEWEKAVATEKHADPYRATNLGDPLALAAVCTKWRDVALKTPQLWSFVMLNYGYTPDKDSQHPHSPAAGKFVAPLEEQLRRSGQADLAIIVYNPPDTDPMYPLTKVLASASHRIRHLHIPVACLNATLSGRNLSRLTFLSVAGTDNKPRSPFEEGDWQHWGHNVVRASNLKHLQLSRCYSTNMPVRANTFPWRQLTSLTMEAWNFPLLVERMEDMADTIVHITIVNEIVYRLHSFINTRLNAEGVIHLHKLESLQLLGQGCGYFMDLFLTPALRHLDIHLEGGGPQKIRNLVDRSSCPLSSLRIRSSSLMPAVLPVLRRHLLGLSLQSLDISSDESRKHRENRVHDVLDTALGDADHPPLDIQALTIRNMMLGLPSVISLAEKRLAPSGGQSIFLRSIALVGCCDCLSVRFCQCSAWENQELKARMGVMKNAGLDIWHSGQEVEAAPVPQPLDSRTILSRRFGFENYWQM